MVFVGESSEDDDLGDAFADFGEEVASPHAVPMIETQTTSLPDIQIEQQIVPVELPAEVTPDPVPPAPAPAPAPVAVAIPDPDAQSSRRKLSPAAEAAALKALGDATPDFTAFVQPRKKKSVLTTWPAFARPSQIR